MFLQLLVCYPECWLVITLGANHSRGHITPQGPSRQASNCSPAEGRGKEQFSLHIGCRRPAKHVMVVGEDDDFRTVPPALVLIPNHSQSHVVFSRKKKSTGFQFQVFFHLKTAGAGALCNLHQNIRLLLFLLYFRTVVYQGEITPMARNVLTSPCGDAMTFNA